MFEPECFVQCDDSTHDVDGSVKLNAFVLTINGFLGDEFVLPAPSIARTFVISG